MCWGVGVQGGGRHSSHQQIILGDQQGIQEVNLILALSTQRKHQVPQVKCSVLEHCPPASLQTQVASPGYKSEVLPTPPPPLFFWERAYRHLSLDEFGDRGWRGGVEEEGGRESYGGLHLTTLRLWSELKSRVWR